MTGPAAVAVWNHVQVGQSFMVDRVDVIAVVPDSLIHVDHWLPGCVLVWGHPIPGSRLGSAREVPCRFSPCPWLPPTTSDLSFESNSADELRGATVVQSLTWL